MPSTILSNEPLDDGAMYKRRWTHNWLESASKAAD